MTLVAVFRSFGYDHLARRIGRDIDDRNLIGLGRCRARRHLNGLTVGIDRRTRGDLGGRQRTIKKARTRDLALECTLRAKGAVAETRKAAFERLGKRARKALTMLCASSTESVVCVT